MWTRLQMIVSGILKLALLAAIFYSLYIHDFLFTFAAATSLLLSLLPVYWHRRFHAVLPFGLDLFTTIALFLHVILGELLRYYDHHFYFDKVMHFYGTGLIGLLAFVTVFTFHWSGKIRLS